MFRRIVSRVIAASAGVQMCAAATALTDKQLAKKPEWYRKDVAALEVSLERLGRHGFNTSPSYVKEAYETLMKYEDLPNAEVQWRLARALVEKAFWTKDVHEQERLLHQAKEYAQKGIKLEGEKRCAGAHKWYAIVLTKLQKLEKKANYYEEIVKHLETAASLDKQDAYTVHLLGVAHYKQGNFAKAIEAFENAEKVRERFSPCNLYYMGASLVEMGKKEEGIKKLIAAYRAHAHNEHEIKSRSRARTMLLHLEVDPAEYEIHPY
ncbi:tetratricopeptide repeat protein [Oesophagostomum dentatum]|uniref:Tetratricopeptide repeat protein n=1 Tax=Oesophagostomum dentatum TaxID=61180 RepID=A0A0B1SNM7_OESDE|nr:tetratricopeptide repeat protein [Oesophagostomum dentatum]